MVFMVPDVFYCIYFMFSDMFPEGAAQSVAAVARKLEMSTAWAIHDQCRTVCNSRVPTHH